MNKARRAEIAIAVEKLEDAKGLLESILEDEREAFDNLPESLQQGDRGEAMSEAISALEEAITSCEGAVTNAETAAG